MKGLTASLFVLFCCTEIILMETLKDIILYISVSINKTVFCMHLYISFQIQLFKIKSQVVEAEAVPKL